VDEYIDPDEYYKNTQAGQSQRGEGKKEGRSKPSNEFASCALGAALGQQVASAITNTATSFLASAGEELAERELLSKFKIPVLDEAVVKKTEATNKKLAEANAKEVGSSFLGTLKLPSLDSIGFCIVNSMILHISESTIRWINTGFEGNPAFIEDFDQFFTDLADREVSVLLTEIANTDLLCGDLKVKVQKNLLESYTRTNYYGTVNESGNNSDACNLDNGRNGGGGTTTNSDGTVISTSGGGKVSVAEFISGDKQAFQDVGWSGYRDALGRDKNVFRASVYAKHKAQNRIESSISSAKTETIDVNNGFMSGKDEDGKVVTPGAVIEKQLETTLNIPTDRLIIADEFDEIMAALVSQLIKIALDETVGKVNRSLTNVQNDVDDTREELRESTRR
jgi:hypothetical protein